MCRLGLAHIFLELHEILISVDVRLKNEKQSNGAGRVRELIDERFAAFEDWVKTTSGDIDWVKRFRYNQTIVSRIGVEIQISGRSDALARDIVHIRNSLQDSRIDVGVIVVASDDMQALLTDRVASFSYAVRYVEHELREAQAYPIILIGIEQDGFADEALPKKTTNLGVRRKRPNRAPVEPMPPDEPQP